MYNIIIHHKVHSRHVQAFKKEPIKFYDDVRQPQLL